MTEVSGKAAYSASSDDGGAPREACLAAAVIRAPKGTAEICKCPECGSVDVSGEGAGLDRCRACGHSFGCRNWLGAKR